MLPPSGLAPGFDGCGAMVGVSGLFLSLFLFLLWTHFSGAAPLDVMVVSRLQKADEIVYLIEVSYAHARRRSHWAVVLSQPAHLSKCM